MFQRLHCDPVEFAAQMAAQAFRFLLTLLGAATGIGAILLIGAPGGPKITPTVSLFQLTGYILFIAAGVLVLRVLFAVFSNR